MPTRTGFVPVDPHSDFEDEVWHAADRLGSIGPLYQLIVVSGEVFNHRHDRLVRHVYLGLAARDVALLFALRQRGVDEVGRRLVWASMATDFATLLFLDRARGARALFSHQGVVQMGLSYAFTLSIGDRTRRGWLHSLWGVAAGVFMIGLRRPRQDEIRDLVSEFAPTLLAGVVLVTAARSILVGSLSDYQRIEQDMANLSSVQLARIDHFLRIHGTVLNDLSAARRAADDPDVRAEIRQADDAIRTLLLRSHLSSERVPIALVLGDLMRRREGRGLASEWRGAVGLDPEIAIDGDDARRLATLFDEVIMVEPDPIEYGVIVVGDRVELLIRGGFGSLTVAGLPDGSALERQRGTNAAIRLTFRISR